jgi:diguanylate cyclase
MMDNPARNIDIISRLHGIGLKLSIDDFGTGYSSLSHLKRLPAPELKIDRSFIMNMAEDENDAIIVRSTIDLAHNMGLKVTAEGVETQDILDVLAVLGCDSAQGYYIARPMPAEQIEIWSRSGIAA